MTKLVHRSEPHDVYIGRPSPWGNPFSHKETSLAIYKTKDKKESLAKYREWLPTQPQLIERMKRELKDKTLGCWCRGGCHGHIIIEFIDDKVVKETKDLF